jgi:hypothetical protein
MYLIFSALTNKINYFDKKKVESDIDGRHYKVVEDFDPETYDDAADRLARINIFVGKLLDRLEKKYIIQGQGTDIDRVYVRNIIKRYNPDIIMENNPNGELYTSFVLNKGDKIGFCLREKLSGKNKFHNNNLIKFVVLHEISHLGIPDQTDKHNGHPPEFWRLFKLLTREAYETGAYIPVDYSEAPVNYCGVSVYYNPFFDESL